MLHIIITSFNEPNSTIRAVEAFLKQSNMPKNFEIIVVDPFPDVGKKIKQKIKDKRVRFFLDPGEGKSYALNILLEEIYSKNTSDIIISTDGDVYVSENSVESIMNCFKDPKVGCVTGKPVALDNKNNEFGYWAHVAFAGIDRVRKKYAKKKRFLECSGYLFAIRNGVISQFPLETSEDSIIPYLFWKKGYVVDYAEGAEVYVKNPDSWKDWLAQKVRNIKAHENLNKFAPDMPRTKSFFNEIKEGAFFAITQPRSLKQFLWTFELYIARLYLYYKAFRELKKNKSYADGWRGEATTESTKTLD